MPQFVVFLWSTSRAGIWLFLTISSNLILVWVEIEFTDHFLPPSHKSWPPDILRKAEVLPLSGRLLVSSCHQTSLCLVNCAVILGLLSHLSDLSKVPKIGDTKGTLTVSKGWKRVDVHWVSASKSEELRNRWGGAGRKTLCLHLILWTPINDFTRVVSAYLDEGCQHS